MEIELKTGGITLEDGEVRFSQGGNEVSFEDNEELELAISHLAKVMRSAPCVHGMMSCDCVAT